MSEEKIEISRRYERNDRIPPATVFRTIYIKTACVEEKEKRKKRERERAVERGTVNYVSRNRL